MIRFAEAVFDGHPDKFCDILADSIVSEAYQADHEAYAQIEVGVWSDSIWLSGATMTRQPLSRGIDEIVRDVGRRIGYTGGNHIDVEKYRISNEACFAVGDPTRWTHKVNDQSIVIGWAGYNARTRFLPPEQFLVHTLRQSMVDSFGVGGRLEGQGPDGKILVRLREECMKWHLEHVLVTVQQKESANLLDIGTSISGVLADAYRRVQHNDPRWVYEWDDVELLVNPNGPLLNGGSDGDNGQTGRKLVMDFYGSRIPLGGGALSGKDLSHIDRAGAYASRQAAVHAVSNGAESCQVTLVYAPNRNEPLDISFQMVGRGHRIEASDFNHDSICHRFLDTKNVERLGSGGHFFQNEWPWNSCNPISEHL